MDSAGEITHETRVPMTPARDAATGFAAVVDAVEAVFAAAPEAREAVTGIGLCAPGPLDPKTGVVLNPPNVPCWRGFPLAAKTQRVFGVPAKVDNDANAAGLTEYLWGAGKGRAELFYATLGTGIGAGIILNGRIHHGRTGNAAEGGRVTIDYRGPRRRAENMAASKPWRPVPQSPCAPSRRCPPTSPLACWPSPAP